MMSLGRLGRGSSVVGACQVAPGVFGELGRTIVLFKDSITTCAWTTASSPPTGPELAGGYRGARSPPQQCLGPKVPLVDVLFFGVGLEHLVTLEPSRK